MYSSTCSLKKKLRMDEPEKDLSIVFFTLFIGLEYTEECVFEEFSSDLLFLYRSYLYLKFFTSPTSCYFSLPKLLKVSWFLLFNMVSHTTQMRLLRKAQYHLWTTCLQRRLRHHPTISHLPTTCTEDLLSL